MSMAWALFETKAKRMRVAIAEMEAAVGGKIAEQADAEGRLRDKLKAVSTDLKRMPIAGSLVWKGRRDG